MMYLSIYTDDVSKISIYAGEVSNKFATIAISIIYFLALKKLKLYAMYLQLAIAVPVWKTCHLSFNSFT